MEKSNDPSEFREFEHSGWSSIISAYDQRFYNLTSQSAGIMLDLAEVAAGESLLDVCTGPGMLAAEAVARGAKVTALDFSDEVITCAKQHVHGVDFIVADAQELPFDDNSFDALVCGFGIIHLPDPQAAFKEMYRVLKPGGRAVVSVWEMPAADNGFGLLFGALMAHGDLKVDLPHGPDFFQFSAPEKLSAALQGINFAGVKVTPLMQTWKLDRATELMDGIIEGTVRTRGLLMAQTDEVKQKIFAAVISGMERHLQNDGRYQVPMPALAGVGVKP